MRQCNIQAWLGNPSFTFECKCKCKLESFDTFDVIHKASIQSKSVFTSNTIFSDNRNNISLNFRAWNPLKISVQRQIERDREKECRQWHPHSTSCRCQNIAHKIKSRWKVITKFNSIRFVCVWWKRILNDVCIKTLTLYTVSMYGYVCVCVCVWFVFFFCLLRLLCIINWIHSIWIHRRLCAYRFHSLTRSLTSRILVNDEKFRQLLQLKHRKCSKSKINLNLV